jgi:hypothetical protein
LCTREDVANAIDVQATSRDYPQIDRLIEAASRGVEQFLHRQFAPTLDTRYFDWPNNQMGTSWRLWLDANELISVTSILSGTASLTSGQYFLEPANYGPPYNSVEVNLGGSGAFSSGSTYQRAIAITGLYGYTDDAISVGTTVGTFNSTDDLVTIADGVLAGVGSVLRVDDERMLLVDRIMADTARTTAADNTASEADNVITLAHDTSHTIYTGEVLLIDGEQMYVTDVAGDTVVVKRAWSGSPLAAHSSGATVYASRQFKVQRGALGTTAAEHLDGSVWSAWQVPGPVRQLCIAEVLNSFQQEQSAYARIVGSGEGQRGASGAGLDDLRGQVYSSHGRKARQRAV